MKWHVYEINWYMPSANFYAWNHTRIQADTRLVMSSPNSWWKTIDFRILGFGFHLVLESEMSRFENAKVKDEEPLIDQVLMDAQMEAMDNTWLRGRVEELEAENKHLREEGSK